MNLPKQETCPKSEDTRLIGLTQGQFAVVDAADFDWLNQWKWYAQWTPSTRSFYARRTATHEGRKRAFLMHRLILGLSLDDRRIGDHIISGDTLNNSRTNLRIASSYENARNARLRSDNTSSHKGINWCSRYGGWIVRISTDTGRIYVGKYSTLEKAIAAQIKAAMQEHGEFALTKFDLYQNWQQRYRQETGRMEP